MYGEPELWFDLLDRLADLALASLRSQVAAGASAVQLFDSWAGALSPGDYDRYVLPASRKVLDGVADLGVPRIHFGVNTGELLGLLASGRGRRRRRRLARRRSTMPERVSATTSPCRATSTRSPCLSGWDVARDEAPRRAAPQRRAPRPRLQPRPRRAAGDRSRRSSSESSPSCTRRVGPTARSTRARSPCRAATRSRRDDHRTGEPASHGRSGRGGRGDGLRHAVVTR